VLAQKANIKSSGPISQRVVRNGGAAHLLPEMRRLCRPIVQVAILANLSPMRDEAGSDGSRRSRNVAYNATTPHQR
jgi:hypothetical protein